MEAFRGYAAHMRTAEFAPGLDALVATAEVSAPADDAVPFLCSDSLWWRCHRRMISDALVLLRGREVQHLGHDGGTTTHVPAAGARVAGDEIFYDAG